METGTVDIAQVNYSVLEPEAEERVLPLAMDMGIAVNINRAFLNGDYFSVVSGKELPGLGCRFRLRFMGAVIAEVHPVAPGGYLRHYRHLQSGTRYRQHRRRLRPFAKPRRTRADRGTYQEPVSLTTRNSALPIDQNATGNARQPFNPNPHTVNPDQALRFRRRCPAAESDAGK